MTTSSPAAKVVVPELFPTGSFSARLRHFFAFTNPMLLLQSKETERAAFELVSAFRATGVLPPGVSLADVRAKALLADNAYAKDGSRIPKAFRVCGYATANLPVSLGLMVATGPLGVAFFQWANQTQNALLNHFNRSGNAGVSNGALAQAYGGAVGTALGISFTSTYFINRVQNVALQTSLRRLVPFASVSSANMLNTFLMRRHELADGAVVREAATGRELGRSPKAAERAIALTALSRAAMTALMLGIPPFIFSAYDKKIGNARPNTRLPFQFGVVAVLIFTVVPVTVALFDPNIRCKSGDLEPAIVAAAGGRADVDVEFDKGL
jgi:hypothetical protein